MARVRIGSAEIELTLKTGRFQTAVDGVKRETKSMQTGFENARKHLRNFTIALGSVAAAGYAAREIFELGSAVEETGSKFDTVFGSQAGSVQRSLDQFATLAGLSKTAAKEVTATTGAIVQGFGIAGRQAAQMSVQVSQLAADLASFNNVPIEETSRAIQAGLTGEMESLKRLGIAVLDADVKQTALVMTGKSLVKELTTQEILMARLALITERAGVQVGDLHRTQDTAAAQARKLSAEIQNLKEAISLGLLPVLTPMVTGLTSFIQAVRLSIAEINVFGARMGLLYQSFKPFNGDGVRTANERLANMRIALARVQAEIHNTGAAMAVATPAVAQMAAGLGEVAGAADGGAETSTEPPAAVAIANVGKRAVESARSFNFLGDVAITVASNLRMVGAAAGYAADEQERLNSAQSKFGAIASGLGFLSGIPGLGALSGLAGLAGTATSGFGIFDTIKNTFFSSAVAEPTLTIRLSGPSNETVQTIRAKLRDLDNLDVPVPI